jgi:hypothetical protein
MNDKNIAEDAKDFEQTDDLDLFFNNFIKKGNVEDEKQIVPGFTIKLKALNTGELLTAESIMLMDRNVPNDIVVKVRSASILSQAILSINGMSVDKEGWNKDEIAKRRSKLYRQLLSMSAYVIQKAYEAYIEIVDKQNHLYSNAEETVKNIENF